MRILQWSQRTMFAMILVGVFCFAGLDALKLNTNQCDDIVVQLPAADSLSDEHFDYWSALGRYQQQQKLSPDSSESLVWTQLNGRHQIVIMKGKDEGQDELLFMTNSDITNRTSEYTGLGATLIPDADLFYTEPSIADLIQTWTVYNITQGYNSSVTEQIGWNYLDINCIDPALYESVTICTNKRILDITLTKGNETVNDPNTDVFVPYSDLTTNSRPVYIQQGKENYLLAYIELSYTQYWALFDRSALTDLSKVATLSTLGKFYATFFSEGRATRPELSSDSWISFQTNLITYQFQSAVKCSATISNCSDCIAQNTDTCLPQPNTNSTMHYCVCKLGYRGERCEEQTLTCPDPPQDFLGTIHDYFQAGPFYPGEIVTVSCNSDYIQLLSVFYYTSTCQLNGKWSSTQECLDYSILPSSVDKTNITEKELVSLVIDEVKLNIAKRSADYGDGTSATTTVAYPSYVSESLFLGFVVGGWNVLPWLVLLIHYLRSKCRHQSEAEKKEVSFIYLLSCHTYVWLILYIIYLSVSYKQELSRDTTDVFYYLNIFSIVWLAVTYLIHIVTMFLCEEWKIINRKHSVIEESYIADLQAAAPKISVCVECYHTQTIQKPVTTTINGRIESYIDPIEEPVVTDHFRKAFKFDSWIGMSEAFEMEPNCITELRLKLRVTCANQYTKDRFTETREKLREDYKNVDKHLNIFQNVLVSSSNIVLHDTRDFVINGVSDSLPCSMKPAIYVPLTLILFGVPLRRYMRNYIVTQEYTIVKQVHCSSSSSADNEGQSSSRFVEDQGPSTSYAANGGEIQNSVNENWNWDQGTNGRLVNGVVNGAHSGASNGATGSGGAQKRDASHSTMRDSPENGYAAAAAAASTQPGLFQGI